jgi:lysophospholipase L1-like esterase
MKKLAAKILCTLFVAAAVSGQAVDAPQFRAGDRWAVLGDSITHNGYYHRYVELFYFTRFPGQPLEVINCGISGDTAAGAVQRVQWDCLDAKPTIVSVMFGMNDIGRFLYEAGNSFTNADRLRAERAETYDRNMRQLAKGLMDSGAKVILIKPSIFDDTADLPKTNCPGLGAALAGFGRRVQSIADEFHLATVDFNAPMTAINREQQQHDPHFTIVGADRIHPTQPGHLVMAYEFLHAQKRSGVVSRITIDAAAGKTGVLENCELKDFTVQSNAVFFDCLEHALPFPVEATAKRALDFVPFTDELNQETLLVRGLAPGNYELLIDGKGIRTISAAELADGVNLSGETNAPQLRQSFQVLAALQKKWEAAIKLRTITLCEHYAWPEARHPVTVAQMPAKLDAWTNKVSHITFFVNLAKQYPELKMHEKELHEQVDLAVEEARRVSQPRSHHFILRPAVN